MKLITIVRIILCALAALLIIGIWPKLKKGIIESDANYQKWQMTSGEGTDDWLALHSAHYSSNDTGYVQTVLTNYNGVLFLRISNTNQYCAYGTYSVSTDTSLTNGTKVRLISITHAFSTTTVTQDGINRKISLAVRYE